MVQKVVTITARTWSQVPASSAVYAMFGGEPPRTWVAYVGLAGDLQRRLIQHFVRRDSSVVTRSSAVGVNVDLVVRVDWWEHAAFNNPDALHAAELIGFEVLQPALVSRGGVRKQARERAADPTYRSEVEALFRSAPTGRYVPPRLGDLARDIESLEARVAELEKRLGDV